MTHDRLREQHPNTKIAKRTLISSLLACIVLVTYLAFLGVPPTQPAHIVQSAPGKLPLAFVPNLGQSQADVLFQANDLNTAFYLTASDLVFSRVNTAAEEQTVVRISHENTQAAVSASGENRLKGQVNYLLGSDRGKWLTHVPTYASVMFHDLYAGIDLKYDGMHGAFEGTYYVSPGADPALISWRVSGNATARLSKDNATIEILNAAGEQVLEEMPPITYQEINGQKVSIPSHFAQNADGSFSYVIGAYDRSKTLVIDPTLVYSSYFGGAKLDTAMGITLDEDGNIYVTGLTASTNFPGEAPLYDSNQGATDIFVLKLNPTGSEMLYSTYLGGDEDDEANGLAVDSTGSVYLAGDTISTDFPLENAYDDTCTRMFNICIPEAFLSQLSADGSELLYSTYLGGDEPDMAESVAVGEDGHVYLSGVTFSENFPTRQPIQEDLAGGGDAFITHIDTSKVGKASLVWSTYLGGGSEDLGAAIGLAGTDLVVAGVTTSADFPTEDPLQQTYAGGQDIFIAGLTTAGTLRYSTYLGGSQQDTVYGIDVTEDGAYITGSTLSTDYPTVAPVQAANEGGNDVIVTSINTTGDEWLFSTYLGGASSDIGYGISVNPAGAIYITGSTSSGDFPLENTLQSYTGNGDAFVARLLPDRSELAYSTLLGASDSDLGVGIVTDDQDNAYIAGNTFSDSFPLENALDDSYAGLGDVFVAIITDSGDNPPPSEPPVVDPPIIIPKLAEINPLFGSLKFASNVVLAPDETLTFTILLHNSSMTAVTARVVDELPAGLDYVAGSANQGGHYDAAKETITWTAVTVPANGEVHLKFDSTTTVTAQKIVVNTASITSGNETIQRYFPVKLGEHQVIDLTRPAVERFVIGSQDVLESQNVVLHITASDNVGVEKMYIREWQVNPNPVPHWEMVKSSGWVDFDSTYPWVLGKQSGVHYLAVVVADEHGNVSMFNKNNVDFASLLLPDTTLDAAGMVPYLVHYDADTPVKATLTPSDGNPTIFAWYPGSIMTPDKASTDNSIAFVTPRDGTYYFLVYSPNETTYTLDLTPGGGPQWTAPGSAPATPGVLQTSPLQEDPVLSKIGFDPFGTEADNMPSSLQTITIFMPLVNQ